MRIVLAGADGSGKRELVRELNKLFPEFDVSEPDTEAIYAPWAVGSLADYRTELMIATERAAVMAGTNILFTHSLLDSVVYASVRLMLMPQNNVLNLSRWYHTQIVITHMLRDSWKSDLVFFLRGNNGEHFQKEVERGFEIVFDELDLRPVILDDDAGQNLEESARIIKTEIEKYERTHAREDNSESSRED